MKLTSILSLIFFSFSALASPFSEMQIEAKAFKETPIKFVKIRNVIVKDAIDVISDWGFDYHANFAQATGARLVDQDFLEPKNWENRVLQPSFSHKGSSRKYPMQWAYDGVMLAKETDDELVFTPIDSIREYMSFIRVRRTPQTNRVRIEIILQTFEGIELQEVSPDETKKQWASFYRGWVVSEDESDLTDFGLSQKKKHLEGFDSSQKDKNPFQLVKNLLETRPNNLPKSLARFDYASVTIVEGEVISGETTDSQ